MLIIKMIRRLFRKKTTEKKVLEKIKVTQPIRRKRASTGKNRTKGANKWQSR